MTHDELFTKIKNELKDETGIIDNFVREFNERKHLIRPDKTILTEILFYARQYDLKKQSIYFIIKSFFNDKYN